jgi:hypothetical protein
MRMRGIVLTSLIAVAVMMWAPATRAADADRGRPGVVADLSEERSAIVGSWLGVNGYDLKLLSTFNADGTMTNSVQSEVSTIPELGVLTPLHGVWKYLGGRQFGVTAFGVLYDINSGSYLGMLKVRIVLTISKSGDQLSGTDKVEIVNPDGTTTFLGSSITPYTRIKFEAFK